ncbi:MAG TPA: hypothetical protein VM054_11675 [bacterium]|nr:hypothetical protein [bacterium]
MSLDEMYEDECNDGLSDMEGIYCDEGEMAALMQAFTYAEVLKEIENLAKKRRELQAVAAEEQRRRNDDFDLHTALSSSSRILASRYTSYDSPFRYGGPMHQLGGGMMVLAQQTRSLMSSCPGYQPNPVQMSAMQIFPR